jgi:hypothetical protein
LKAALPIAAQGAAPSPEDEDKELAVLLFAGRYMFDRWFAEEADSGAPRGRFPRSWNVLSQADFDRLNQEAADKLQAFRERHEVVIDVGSLAAALRVDTRHPAAKFWAFTWREALAGIIGATAAVIFVVLLTVAYSALGGPNLARGVVRFLTVPQPALSIEKPTLVQKQPG